MLISEKNKRTLNKMNKKFVPKILREDFLKLQDIDTLSFNIPDCLKADLKDAILKGYEYLAIPEEQTIVAVFRRLNNRSYLEDIIYKWLPEYINHPYYRDHK